ncbi:MAG: SulP family inorganic anion transporter [Actinomycetota bacterium]|nr:SulP family inorganic anion transporter [Actinomycetota bacterium]
MREVLAGLVVALALIPEAISFSILAGVDPRVGLFSSFIMAVTTAILGGRPAMISAATGAVAIIIAPVAREYGLDYFLATVVLAGIFQIIMAAAGVAKLMRFIPRSVMIGFVNALAIIIFLAQLPYLIPVAIPVYLLVVVGLLVMIFFPKITSTIPAPLIAIVSVSLLVLFIGVKVPTVGDEGDLPESLPELLIPNVPINTETFQIIAPYAFAMALVGLLETLMTAKLVDEITDTRSEKTRESYAQGIGNFLSGLLGGMGGCAMIGQTMINVKGSGARTRISTFVAGVILLFLVIVLGEIVSQIPMAALVAVMIMVSIGTFNWHSIQIKTLKAMPKTESFVMISTVAIVLLTHNLAIGVIAGIVLEMIMFARRVAHFAQVTRTVGESNGVGGAYYRVEGELFFASSNDLTMQFEYSDDPENVVIDLSQAHIWDPSTVAALDSIIDKYARINKTVYIKGMNEYSSGLYTRLAGRLTQE